MSPQTMYGIGYQEFLIGLVILLPLLLATFFLVPYVASQKDRSGFAWFWIAVLMTPLLALIALAALPHQNEKLPVNPFDFDKGTP